MVSISFLYPLYMLYASHVFQLWCPVDSGLPLAGRLDRPRGCQGSIAGNLPPVLYSLFSPPYRTFNSILDKFARFYGFRVCLESRCPLQKEECRDLMTTPEEPARQNIDKQLAACGRTIQEMFGLNRYAGLGVAVREFPLETGEADYLGRADDIRPSITGTIAKPPAHGPGQEVERADRGGAGASATVAESGITIRVRGKVRTHMGGQEVCRSH
jgi:hypothetical protein